ncbi:hypothetical protein [Leptothoe spongobia]|uniref:Uncharacterized protein n=1 Tax=Leptothoe spongobia TAU-MAC 1115 TaxID=1967444 RepID=A0A947DKW8_9CYAN|nr:hypothetical protein [Leptothoe spongobia]MBT9317759.1 hypothetical protein [Leptothoe spongobia TAU-MAC 1115]
MELSSLKLESIELKFLLRLLEYGPDYRASISKIQPNSKTRASERNQICQDLCSKGLVEYTDEIPKYQTETAGKALLESETNMLPITDDELQLVKKLLDVAVGKSATPGTAKQVPANERQRLLKQLEEKGLISVVGKKVIKDVWLTQTGYQYLQNDCHPTSSYASLTFSMLGTYLTFLRETLGQKETSGTVNNIPTKIKEEAGHQTSPSTMTDTNGLSPKSVLDTIRMLDQQLDTDNFLPIFHLREKLQPPLNREGLDKLLFTLQSQDLIELSTLQDVSNYTDSERDSGIAQPDGGAWFYISVND